jgi:hypothetical protein
MSDAETTAPKQQIGVPFEAGKSGNPKGRPKGSRNKLAEDFLKALSDDFTAHGAQVIAEVRMTKPSDYLKACVAILPKELNVKINELDEMRDDELIERLNQLDAAINAALGGAGQAEGGAAETHQHPQASVLPALH